MLKTILHPISVACLLVGSSYLLVGCSSTTDAHIGGSWDIPFGPKIEFDVTKNGDGTSTGTVTGLPPGKCLKTTYTDSEGNELPGSPVYTPIDNTGTASGPIPADAKRQQSSVEDCPPEPEPDPDPEDVDGEEPVPPPTSGGGMSDPFQVGQAGERTAVLVPTFHFFGGTIQPDDSLGAENLSYSIFVQAQTHGVATSIVNHILSAGIGAIVPNSVIVDRYTVMTPTLAGARIITANPDGIDVFTFDLNQGAHYADLASSTNVLTYAQGSWDVVETVVPLSAFNNSILPGASYENHADFSWSTTRFLETFSGDYTIDVTN